MSRAFESLPPEVQTALLRGRTEEAAALLRKATGVALKSASARIAATLAQGLPVPVSSLAPGATSSRRDASGTGATASAPVSGAAAAQPPGLDVLAGRLIALLRAAAERRHGPAGRRPAIAASNADDAIEGWSPTSGRAPGEQPQHALGDLAAMAAAAALVTLLVWLQA